jgi:hypothetical protein
MAPFHIKAQVLRKAQLEPTAALGVFDARLTEADLPSDELVATTRARWKQTDLKRALSAAEQAGLSSYRVEIAPDGTISIVVGDPADTAASPDAYRDLMNP